MAVISLKVDSEFLDMDNAVIRITYTNNLFEEGAAPGVASYPFELPPTDHNLRILGQHNRLDNPESLLGTVPVSAFLYDDFYMDCLLTFQSIDKSIKASIAPALTKKYSEFSNQKLTELNYGDFEKKYIPENYRYSIGYFKFDVGNTLEINIDSNTYTQIYTSSPENTLLLLIDQINADETINKINCKFLKKLDSVYPESRLAVLFQGLEKINVLTVAIEIASPVVWDPILGDFVPLAGYAEYVHTINHQISDPDVSAISVHMRHVNYNELGLYELAFGEFPYKFPCIYNPDYVVEPIFGNSYDHIINSYDVSQSKYLVEFYGYQLNTQEADLPVCPQLLLEYVVNKIFNNFGMTLESNFFNNNELKKLLLLNIADMSTILRDEILRKGPKLFLIKDFLPDSTVEEICVGIKKTFSQHFFYNFKQGKVLMLSSREILDSDEYFDLNPILLQGETIEPFEKYSNGFAFSYTFDSNDEYPQNEIKDVSIFPRIADVPIRSSLPSTDNWKDESCLVIKENKFYVYSELFPSGFQWSFYSENFQKEVFGNGKLKIESTLEPVLMATNPKRKTNYSETGGGTGFVDSNMNIPKIKQPGKSLFHRQLEPINTSRLMFWRGFDHQNYPKANYDVFDDIGVKRYQYSLKLTGLEGTINRFHEPFIRNLSSIKKKVTKTGLLTKNEILDYKIWKLHRVESQNMICGKMDVIFDNSKNCIRPAQFELYKK